MKVLLCIILAAMLTVGESGPLSDRVNLSPSSVPRPLISSRFNFIDTEMLRATGDREAGNFMVAPASVKAALVMLLEGAGGSCAEELRSTLRLPADQGAYRDQMRNFLLSLKERSSGVTLESANTIFLSSKLTPEPVFSQLLRDYYDSRVQAVDFTSPPVAARTINAWANENTHGLIPVLVDAQNIQSDTVMVLSNALYFKGQWEYAFEKELTKPGTFRGSQGQVLTPMMELQNELKYTYAEDMGLQAVELPYQGGKYSMLIVLPDENIKIDSLVKDLPQTYSHMLTQLEETDVKLTLPRFTIEYATDLVPVLQSIGIRELFTPSANLSGIIGHYRTTQVNNVFHKTFIRVNEEGTEAAAITGAMVIPLMGSNTATMIVNRSFLFFIRDTKTGTILFEGRVDQPDSVPVPSGNRPSNQPLPASYNAQPLPTSYNAQPSPQSFNTQPTPDANQGGLNSRFIIPNDVRNQQRSPAPQNLQIRPQNQAVYQQAPVDYRNRDQAYNTRNQPINNQPTYSYQPQYDQAGKNLKIAPSTRSISSSQAQPTHDASPPRQVISTFSSPRMQPSPTWSSPLYRAASSQSVQSIPVSGIARSSIESFRVNRLISDANDNVPSNFQEATLGKVASRPEPRARTISMDNTYQMQLPPNDSEGLIFSL